MKFPALPTDRPPPLFVAPWVFVCLAFASLFLVFVAHPAAAAEQETSDARLRIAVISDLNGSYGSVGHRAEVHAAIQRIIELDPDLVISTGDMVAGQDPQGLPAEKLDAMWQAFHAAVTEPLAAAGIPLAVTPGNHDASAYEAFAMERDHYARAWRNSTAGINFVDGDGFPFRYAFAVSDVLVISLDVTLIGSLPDADVEWLDELLGQHRSRFRNAVVFSHVPVWPVAEKRRQEATSDERLHALLVDSGIDLYLSGHHHAFYPGALDGVTYVSQACLGSAPRQLVGSESGRSPKAFTLVEFKGQRILVGAYRAPGFKTLIDWETLPRHIAVGGRLLRRADRVDVAISPLPAQQETSR